MGRRSRKNKPISKKKFINQICKKCKVCSGNFTPSFCYKKMYKNNTDKFLGHTLKRLFQNQNPLKLLVGDTRTIYDDLTTPIFKEVFCKSNSCTHCAKSHNQTKQCMYLFREQLLQYSKVGSIIRKLNVMKPKKKDPPSVTIICSDNEDFKEEVQRIIENNSKQ